MVFSLLCSILMKLFIILQKIFTYNVIDNIRMKQEYSRPNTNEHRILYRRSL